MVATFEDVERWKAEAQEKGATHIVSVCDTFSHDDYPVYVMPNENPQEIASKYRGQNMQTVNEIIEIESKKTKTDSESVEGLRHASKCVYLSTEESVAKDISERLTWAANEIERLHSLLEEAGVGT